jgi:hypothetical protein
MDADAASITGSRADPVLPRNIQLVKSLAIAEIAISIAAAPGSTWPRTLSRRYDERPRFAIKDFVLSTA